MGCAFVSLMTFLFDMAILNIWLKRKSNEGATVAKKPYHRKISGRRGQLGPYPMERLKKVNQPTT